MTAAADNAHRLLLPSWQRYAAREVRVTVNAPGDISIRYVDGCDGQPRGTSAQTLARVEVLAMHWIEWTVVYPDGSEETRKGYIHPDFDEGASACKYAAEMTRRELVRDLHPRSRELSWRCYETALEYHELGICKHSALPSPPKYSRPTAEEIAASPL